MTEQCKYCKQSGGPWVTGRQRQIRRLRAEHLAAGHGARPPGAGNGHCELVNLSAQISSPEWERKLIPIRIPIDKGLSGYRISLIDGDARPQFSALTNLTQLKALSLGAGRQWSVIACPKRIRGWDGTFGLPRRGIAQTADFRLENPCCRRGRRCRTRRIGMSRWPSCRRIVGKYVA